MAKQIVYFDKGTYQVNPLGYHNWSALARWFCSRGFIDDKHTTLPPSDAASGVPQSKRYLTQRKSGGKYVDAVRGGFVKVVRPGYSDTYYFDVEHQGMNPEEPARWQEDFPMIVVDSDAISVGAPKTVEPLDEVIRGAKQFMVNAAKRAFLGLYSETEWRVFANAWIAEQDKEDD